LFKQAAMDSSVLRETTPDMTVLDVIKEMEGEMAEAAAKLEYERAALLRDQIRELKKQSGLGQDMTQPQPKVDYREALRKKKRGKRA
jgi:excinuclease ABC subunit B